MDLKKTLRNSWRAQRTSLSQAVMALACFVLFLLAALPAGAQNNSYITLAASATSLPAGQVESLHANVSAHEVATVGLGTVDFCDGASTTCTDIHRVGTAQLVESGGATLSVTPGLGKHSYYAIYRGITGTYGLTSSTSNTVTVTVTGMASSTTALSESGNAGNYTLTATTTGSGSGAPPAGVVSFVDQNFVGSGPGGGTLGTRQFEGAATLGFATRQASPAVYPSTVVSGDFNGDGKPDVAVLNTQTSGVTVLLGNGDGTFGAPLSTAIDANNDANVSAAVGDLNSDGKLDLVVADEDLNLIWVLLGNGDGTFQVASSALTCGSSPAGVAIAGVSGSGNLDIVVANHVATGTVCVLHGYGDGTFGDAATYSIDAGVPRSVAAGDFNKDGLLDLATANQNGSVSILLALAAGGYAPAVSYPVSGGLQSIVVADFNGDGNLDLAGAQVEVNTITVLLGSASGTFKQGSLSSISSSTYGLVYGDFNNDGIVDLAALVLPSNVQVLTGVGDGSFGTPVSSDLAGSGPPLAVAAADYNGDGEADLAAVGTSVRSITVLLSQLSVSSTLSNVAVPGSGAHTIEAQYSGSGSFNPSQGSTTVTAAPIATALTLRPSGPAAPGATVTLTATVSPNTLTEGYNAVGTTVAFFEGMHELGTATLTPNGQATFSTTIPTGLPASIFANYLGNTYFAPSTGPLLPAPPLTTTLRLSATVAANSSGQPVTLTATLNPYSLGAYSTNGEPVQFTVGTQQIPALLSNGSASISIPPGTLASGNNTFVANYAGDPYLAASSATLPYGSAAQVPTCTVQPTILSSAAGTVTVSVGACTDPRGLPLTETIQWGDQTPSSTVTNGQPTQHTYTFPMSSSSTAAVSNSYTAVVTATDTAGLSVTASYAITPPAIITAGTSVTVTPPVPPPPQTVIVTFVCTSVSIQGAQATSVLPSQYGISCAPTEPVTVSANSPLPAVTISTTASSSTTAALTRPGATFLALAFPFPLLGGAVLALKRKRGTLLLLGCMAITLGLLGGCGGSFRPPAATITAANHYAVTVLTTVTSSGQSGGTSSSSFTQTSLIVPLNVDSSH